MKTMGKKAVCAYLEEIYGLTEPKIEDENVWGFCNDAENCLVIARRILKYNNIDFEKDRIKPPPWLGSGKRKEKKEIKY